MKLRHDWKRRAVRSPHTYVALFWGGLSGLLLVWPALADTIPVQPYMIGGVVISASIAVAKLFHTPGADE